MRWDIGIDLGTQNVRVAELRRGPVLDAPAALMSCPNAENL